MTRRIMLYYRPERKDAVEAAQQVRELLETHGIVTVSPDCREAVELLVVFGGDGTILEAAEYARERNIPIVGVNLGHVGFLAEAEPEDLDYLADQIVNRHYRVDNRMTIDICVKRPDGSIGKSWALNDAAVIGTDRGHPALLALGVDGRAVSEFGADGLIIATPTGSTAYSFSCGGPVIWPDVEALAVTPLAAHGLFTRPLVVAPNSTLEVQILSQQRQDSEVWCDGRRILSAPPGSSITAVRGQHPVLLARISQIPFSARLVAKFNLPVERWGKKEP